MSDQNRTKIIGLVVIVLLSAVGTTGAVAYNNRPIAQPSSFYIEGGSSRVSNAPTGIQPTNTTSSSASSSPAPTYKDGTYSANGTFYTPDGTEQIGVAITIANNNITNVSIDSSSIYSRTSAEYTSVFSDGINQVVDGRNVNDVRVSRISGASLTPMGFNNALEMIKHDAQA